MAEGKDYCIVLDHAGNHHRLGLVTDINCDGLDDGEDRKIFDRARQSRTQAIHMCPACHCVLPPRARECPACGEPILAVTPVIEADGELVEVGSGPAGRVPQADEALWHGALVKIGRRKGYAPGWASHQFKARFGRWPMQRYAPEREPTIEILNWVRSRQIVFAKARRASG